MIVAGMLFGLIEMLAHRILRCFLKIRVDCRMNAETFVHSAIPPDRGDDLLADVIDCVGLALRILAAAGRHLFGLRTGASITTD